ncbi:hypothetical protein ABCS02_17615 [Microbacterium sp. X-17]|uniref:hypothetical protein n=1 Tax=Microbacterium sp. X-17 TaxID=3144404 RepID=UPI0031F4CF2B
MPDRLTVRREAGPAWSPARTGSPAPRREDFPTLVGCRRRIPSRRSRPASTLSVDTAENQPDQFAHELQRQRDNHARAELVTAEQQRLTDAGFTILDNRPEEYWDKEHINIGDLLTADGTPSPLTT